MALERLILNFMWTSKMGRMVLTFINNSQHQIEIQFQEQFPWVLYACLWEFLRLTDLHHWVDCTSETNWISLASSKHGLREKLHLFVRAMSNYWNRHRCKLTITKISFIFKKIRLWRFKMCNALPSLLGWNAFKSMAIIKTPIGVLLCYSIWVKSTIPKATFSPRNQFGLK